MYSSSTRKTFGSVRISPLRATTLGRISSLYRTCTALARSGCSPSRRWRITATLTMQHMNSWETAGGARSCLWLSKECSKRLGK